MTQHNNVVLKVLPNHYIAVDLNIELFLFEECYEKIIYTQILDNSRIFIDSNCDSLFIREASNSDFILCVHEPLTNDQSTQLETLFSNIADDILLLNTVILIFSR